MLPSTVKSGPASQMQGQWGWAHTTQRHQPRQPLLHHVASQQPEASTSTAGLKYSIRQARDDAELRAAAYLRAYSFYSYPEDRSPMAARAHRRMKGDAEWDSVTAKVAGKEPNYKDMRVSCFISTLDDDPDSPVVQQASQDMDLSTKLPAAPDAGRALPQLVVGSLDLNIGAVLPAEELVGRLPAESPSTRRAYLSNVCVAKAARRQGIAQALMAHAEREAAAAGVTHLYVHVVHDNVPAVAMYQRALGFQQEAQETARVAQLLQRPRRLLLVKHLA